MIDRYVTAVRHHLPDSLEDREGIVAELADAVESDLEDRQALLGRPLTSEEIAQFVKGFGHPRSVAARYGGRHGLVDAEVFPFYTDVLTGVLSFAIPCELLIFTAIAVATHNMALFWDGLGAAWQSLLLISAIVTILFAVFERLPQYEHRLAALGCDWDPRMLPASYAANPANTRISGFADFFFNAFALLLLLEIPSSGIRWLSFVTTPAWHPLYDLTIVASGLSAIAGLLTLAVPSLIRVRDWTRVAVNAMLIAGCAAALRGVWGTSSVAIIATLVIAIALLAVYAIMSFRSAYGGENS